MIRRTARSLLESSAATVAATRLPAAVDLDRARGADEVRGGEQEPVADHGGRAGEVAAVARAAVEGGRRGGDRAGAQGDHAGRVLLVDLARGGRRRSPRRRAAGRPGSRVARPGSAAAPVSSRLAAVTAPPSAAQIDACGDLRSHPRSVPRRRCSQR